jgi:hypothetical protein
MKHKILFCFLSISMFLQTPTLQAQGWLKYYKIDTSLYGSDPRTILEADGLGYFMLALTSNNPILYRLDADGSILNTKSLNIGSYALMTKIANDNLIIYGKKDLITEGFNIVRVDALGRELWRRNYPHLGSQESAIRAITTTGGQPILILRGVDSTFSPVRRFCRVLRFDNANGNIVWSKTYNDQWFSDALARPNDEVLIAIRDSTSSKTYANGKFIWLNTLGDVRREQALDSVPLNCDFIGDKYQNSFYFFLQRGTKPTFRKFDNDGNTLKRLVNTNLTTSSHKFTLSKDGLLVLTGYSTQTIANTIFRTFLLHKLDTNGNLITSKEFFRRPFGNDVFSTESVYGTNEIISTRDSGFLISGYRYYEVIVGRDTLGSGEITSIFKLIKDGTLHANNISGIVRGDQNADCQANATEPPIKLWAVKAEKTNGSVFWSATDSLGRYNVNVDTGTFSLSVLPPTSYWQNCSPPIMRSLPNVYTVDSANLVVRPQTNCPSMFVDVSVPYIRRCSSNVAFIRYCNQGTVIARNAYIEVKIDSLLQYVGATRPLSNRNGQTLIFNIGDVNALDCGSFRVDTRTRCGDSTRIGQTLCIEAKIFPDTICSPPMNWSGANVVAFGRCDRDSVRFTVKNTTAIQTAVLRSSIVEDEIVFLNENRSIAPNGSRTLAFPANGKTWRLNQQQEPNNPRNTAVSAVVEGCRSGSGSVSIGFINDFPNTTGDPTVASSCMPLLSSYDPNEKLAFPEGFKSQHFIEQNTAIDYQIGFQNTGNDTAFTVLLRDTLSDELDISTLKVGTSSHAYTWYLSGKNILTFNFKNIKLVDSFHNEPASHGFVKFRINQKKNVSIGTRIENQAAIYFDFNAPIFTNKTFHTVDNNLLRVSVEVVANEKMMIQVYPNPFSDVATFEVTPSVKAGHFELFDALGRQLRSEKFEGSRYRFERRDLPAGIYFFKIENGGRLVGTGKFLVK